MKQIAPFLFAMALAPAAHAGHSPEAHQPPLLREAPDILLAQAAPPARPQRTQPETNPERPRAPNVERRPTPPIADAEPWLQVHFAELDENRDGVVSRSEIDTEVQRTFTGYDVAKSGKVAITGLGAGVRTALAGFVREHAAEVDRDRDGFVTREEVSGALVQMFNRADANRDGRTDLAEIAAGGNAGGGNAGGANAGQRRGGAAR